MSTDKHSPASPALACDGLVRCACGSTSFEVDVPVRGVWTQYLKSTAAGLVVEDTNLDRLKYGKEPKTMKCAACGRKLRRDTSAPNNVSQPTPAGRGSNQGEK